jgi:hypothetical protein
MFLGWGRLRIRSKYLKRKETGQNLPVSFPVTLLVFPVITIPGGNTIQNS